MYIYIYVYIYIYIYILYTGYYRKYKDLQLSQKSESLK